MAKHNKKRNVLFVYEALIHDLAKARLVEDVERTKKIVDVLRRFFSSGTEINKELSAATHIAEAAAADVDKAIQESDDWVSRFVDQVKLREEKDQLISEINRSLGGSIFGVFIPKYKKLASVGQLFDSRVGPKERASLKEALRSFAEEPEAAILRPLDEFEFKMFCEEFNKEYEEFYPEQKTLLEKYATAIQDELEFKVYLNQEVGRLRKCLLEVSSDKADEETVSSLVSVLDEYRTKPVDDDGAANILRIQKLVRQLQDA